MELEDKLLYAFRTYDPAMPGNYVGREHLAELVGLTTTWWLLRSQLEADKGLPQGPILPVVSPETIKEVTDNWEYYKRTVAEFLYMDEIYNPLIEGIRLAVEATFDRLAINEDLRATARLGMLFAFALLARQQKKQG